MRKYRINFLKVSFLFLFIFIFSLSLRKIMDYDLGFHLRGGEWMIENKSFHKYDVFTYTVNNNEYIAMYWLFQILIFLIYKISGYKGLSFLTSILVTLLFLIIFLRMNKRRIHKSISFIVILAVVLIAELRFSLRPELFSYIFLITILFILDEHFYKRKNYLYLLPFIQVLWTNFHGIFILGWAVMGFYFISYLYHYKKFDKEFFKYVFISILSSFLNPYFLKGVLFPFYLFTRLQEKSVFKDVIFEFTSPFSKKALFLMPKTPLILFYIFIFLTILFFILTFKKRKIHEFLILFSFLYLSYTAIRNIPLFLIASSQILALSIDNFYDSIKKFLNYLFYVFDFILLLFFIRILTNSFYYDRGGGNFGIGLDENVQPIGASNFILKNNLKGRILNDLNHGSWLIWSVREPVFIDGRLEVMKEKFFKKYKESFKPGGLPQLIKEYKPDIVIFDYSYPEALFWDRDIKSMPEWRMIYADDKSVIFAHRDFMPHIGRVNFMKIIKEMGIDTVIDEKEVWEILNKKKKSWLINWFEGFYKRKEHDRKFLNLAFYAYLSLEFKCAEILYLNLLKRDSKYRKSIYFNLGAIYYFTGKFDKAIFCYEKVLEE
ncbi:MAG: tetratricopeptide repeat protein, partial [candidate division WOR-3 bacterium]